MLLIYKIVSDIICTKQYISMYIYIYIYIYIYNKNYLAQIFSRQISRAY
jgi:hypothetical protein